jgi:hypothetical protein
MVAFRIIVGAGRGSMNPHVLSGPDLSTVRQYYYRPDMAAELLRAGWGGYYRKSRARGFVAFFIAAETYYNSGARLLQFV